MMMLDSRRLTGINVIWKRAGAVVDVRLGADEDAEQVIETWQHFARSVLDAVGWKEQQSAGYRMHSGVALAISAPVDALYAAVEVAEYIYSLVDRDCGCTGGKSTMVSCDDPQSAEIDRLRQLIEEERNPALIRLLDEAGRRGVTVLCDDDEVSVGLGRHATVMPVTAITGDIDWSRTEDVPIGLVTGTNGKTTTVRLVQQMLRAAGLSVGLSSTDWIGVDDTIIDRGDYSGPGGARAVLRETIDVAILETARGGLLRRGLGVPRADAALITNIAEDHLGDFGSENLEELLNLKWIVMRALDQNSVAVLNADDDRLVRKSAELSVPVCWFALESGNPIIQQHITNGQPVVTLRDGRFCRFDGHSWHDVCAVKDAPITVHGNARHNIANALAAIALAHSLGAGDDAIRQGLMDMRPNDNPGRCNFFSIDGVDVLIDFAHNASAMRAVFDIAASHPAKRRFLCFGQAGDRPDESIRELGRLAWNIGLDHVFISELVAYRRGREPNEVFELLSQGLVAGGATRDQISHHEDEEASFHHALEMAGRGDLVIMLALAEARKILAWLDAHGSATDDQ